MKSTAGGSKITTHISVISLATSVSRRQLFSAAAPEGVDWSFFDAYTALTPALQHDASKSFLLVGRAIQASELGCYASHYEAWRSFMASGADQLIVLEDDVTCDWERLRFIARQDFAAMNMHYLRLYAKQPTPTRVIASSFLHVHFHLVQFLGFAFGTQGYLLTRTGAETLLEHCQVVRRTIDWTLDRSWAHGLPNLAILPFPLFERFVPSTIGFTPKDHSSLTKLQRARLLQLRAVDKVGQLAYRWRTPRLNIHGAGQPTDGYDVVPMDMAPGC